MPRQTRLVAGWVIGTKTIKYATFHHELGADAWRWLTTKAGNGYPKTMYLEYQPLAAWEHIEDGRVVERAGDYPGI